MTARVVYQSGKEDTLAMETYFEYQPSLPGSVPPPVRTPGPSVAGYMVDRSRSKIEPVEIELSASLKIGVDVGNRALQATMYPSSSKERTIQFDPSTFKMISSDHVVTTSDNVVIVLRRIDARPRERFAVSRIYFQLSVQHNNLSVVRPLPHFFGSLAATKQGCQLIVKHGDVKRFMQIINDGSEAIDTGNAVPFVNEKADPPAHVQLCPTLWAIGHIGSTDTGLELLNKHNMVARISELAHTSRKLSIRGTCLYILGFFSRTRGGERQLRDLGFDFPVNNLRHDLAIVVPTDLDKYFDFDPEPFIGSWPLDDANTVGYRNRNRKPRTKRQVVRHQQPARRRIRRRTSRLTPVATTPCSRTSQGSPTTSRRKQTTRNFSSSRRRTPQCLETQVC